MPLLHKTQSLEGLTNCTAQVPSNIELWPTGKFLPYARNARTHSDAQVAQIAASIAEFGFNNPILVDSKAGIVAGHGRLLAARKLEGTNESFERIARNRASQKS